MAELVVERAFDVRRKYMLVAVDVALCEFESPPRSPHPGFEREGFVFQAADFQVVLGFDSGQHGCRQVIAICDELRQFVA